MNFRMLRQRADMRKRKETVIEEIYPRAVSGDIVAPLPSGLVPARQPLTGRYVELVPLDAARHAADLYAASHGTEDALHIWDYMKAGPWPDLEAFTAALRQQAAALDPICFAIRPLDGEAVCGQASYLNIEAQNGVIEIGSIWFGPQLRRTRAATEAMFLLLDHALGDLGYRRMEWKCNALNKNSRNAARRLGFRFEGIFYNHTIAKGRNRDSAWYSILGEEWPALREVFETWLWPSNFDENGIARQSLSDLTAAR